MRFNNHLLWRWLLVAASIYFVARGPWRAIHDSGDLLTVFLAARCWAHGMNPYASADLVVSAQAAKAQMDTQVDAEFFARTPSVYLPPALLLLSPLTAFPWAAAKAIWLFCSMAVSACAIVALSRMADAWGAGFWAFILAFAPFQTGISKGQPSVLACSLIVLSIAIPRQYIGGLLLGTALCIKPQLAIGFLILAILQRQSRKLIAACITSLAVSATALILLKEGSLVTLMSNLSEVSSPSGINSGSALNPLRYQLIDLGTVIPQTFHAVPALASAYALVALLSVIAIVRGAETSTALAITASATVLIGYHRFYDAQILWLGVPALLVIQGRGARILWATYCALLIPGQTMAAQWLKPGMHGLWPFLLMHHETLICAAAWLTVVAQSSGLSATRPPVKTEPPPPSAAWNAASC